MRHIGLMAGGAFAALSLAACNPPHPHLRGPLRVIATLDCPDSQGDLTRQSAAADGKSCAYTTGSGDQVTLQLVSLDGKDLGTALGPIEARMKTEVPSAMTEAPTPPSPSGAPTPPPPPNGGKDKVDIDLPGIHIHSSGDGHADVDTAGVHVDAHDDDGHDHGQASVQVGGPGAGVNINANNGGAQIRIDEKGSGLRARYILASETPGPHGFKAASYEALGPAGGPVAVAVVLMKSDDNDDDLRHDVHKLLKLNVGD